MGCSLFPCVHGHKKQDTACVESMGSPKPPPPPAQRLGVVLCLHCLLHGHQECLQAPTASLPASGMVTNCCHHHPGRFQEESEATSSPTAYSRATPELPPLPRTRGPGICIPSIKGVMTRTCREERRQASILKQPSHQKR